MEAPKSGSGTKEPEDLRGPFRMPSSGDIDLQVAVKRRTIACNPGRARLLKAGKGTLGRIHRLGTQSICQSASLQSGSRPPSQEG